MSDRQQESRDFNPVRKSKISSRLEEYKKALQTVARMERLFAKGSEIKRKMRARAGLSD